MSAVRSSWGSASRPTTRPPKRSAIARARSAWRLATKIVSTPRSASARGGQLARLAGADDHHLAVAQVADDVAREVDGDAGDADPALADRRLGAHALAGLQRGA